MSLKNGIIKTGTVVFKKVRLYRTLDTTPDGVIIESWLANGINKIDLNSYSHYKCIGYGIVELVTLEDGLIPLKHRRGTKDNNNWDDGVRKCRIPKAYVKSITPFNIYSNESWITARSQKWMEYTVGSVVVPDSYNNDKEAICTHGIHVFLTRAEAEAYSI